MISENVKKNFKIDMDDILRELENSGKYKGRIEICNTFLEQDKNRWGRGKRRLFEDSLDIKNLYYFAYVKFYLDDDNNKYALVAGKSGSKKVNYKSDVKFCEYPDKGKAKKWLHDNDKNWWHEEILIIKTISEEKKISEKEALDIEACLVKTFGLCES
ncbi:hypothetical protein ABFV83_08320 [Lacrimispora sp. BS-2]|uniref:EXLDI protein n=1 Tax=Lacrimispora sp. BS-2 TaxID=3151850 RepID=A0AAU7PVN6_9FIRM